MINTPVHIAIDDTQVRAFFADMPNKIGSKAMVSIMRKGATAINGEIRKAMPGNIKKFKSALGAKVMRRSDPPGITAGFMGRKIQYVNRTGQRWDAFTLAYWHNYGTMANRDPSHEFSKARRPISAKRKGGIRPLHFFEKGVEAGTPTAEKKMLENADQIVIKTASKYGFK